jgi:hypothetical protein
MLRCLRKWESVFEGDVERFLELCSESFREWVAEGVLEQDSVNT